MTQVIALLGKKRSGKSTIAKYLTERYTSETGQAASIMSFASTLRANVDGVLDWLGLSVEQIEEVAEEKERLWRPLALAIARVERHFDDQVYFRETVAHFNWVRNSHNLVIFDDARYTYELDWLEDIGAKFVWLYGGDSSTDPSELQAAPWFNDQLKVEPRNTVLLDSMFQADAEKRAATMWRQLKVLEE